MTQFMVVIGSADALEPILQRLVSPQHDAHFRRSMELAGIALTAGENAWVYRDAEELFLRSLARLLETGDLAQTELGAVLTELCACAEQIVIWYASESTDLPEARTEEQLLSVIASQLSDPPNEVYVHYRRET